MGVQAEREDASERLNNILHLVLHLLLARGWPAAHHGSLHIVVVGGELRTIGSPTQTLTALGVEQPDPPRLDSVESCETYD